MIKQALIALTLVLALSGAVLAEESVNINTATAEELAEVLNGIGEARAQAIVEYRESNGSFTHPDELINVRGIGMATLDRNRDSIELGDSE